MTTFSFFFSILDNFPRRTDCRDDCGARVFLKGSLEGFVMVLVFGWGLDLADFLLPVSVFALEVFSGWATLSAGREF